MNILSYIQPERAYLPCTGVGRHINNMTLGLAAQPDYDVTLLTSQEYVSKNGQLDARTPLHSLPVRTFPGRRLRTERLWKLTGRPKMDAYIGDADLVYSPVSELPPLRSSVPKVMTVHDIQAFETNLPWSHHWEHRLFRLRWGLWLRQAIITCQMVFAASEFTRQRLIALLSLSPDKITVVGNGVEPAYFEIAKVDPASLDVQIEKPYALVVGGLRMRKGADAVLNVAKALSDRRSSVQIVVAGSSEATYIDATRSLSNVRLLGVIDDARLTRLLRKTTALLFLSPYEGFGIPAAEAMAAGVPTVVANRASLPEVVGTAGIVVEPTHADEIAEILSNLDRDETLRTQYSEAGRSRASNYTWEHCVERAMTAFDALI